MARQAAIYLGHLSPLTIAHENIISFLLRDCDNVYVFPVRFLKENTEINTKSFPFPYHVRKAMIEAVFTNNDRVIVLPDYAFFSPFIKYVPPLISPYSWILRRQILKSVKEETFVSYSGDRIERIVLSIYRLHPIGGKRLSFSSSSVKEMLYTQVTQENSKERLTQEILAWQDKVPKKVVNIIKDNWYIIQEFAKSPDLTIRIMGTKFPKNGFLF
jgi:nicotinamide mononucleotide adenylyltransferase